LKKILILIFLGFILSGCATYKFQKSANSSVQGYLACYDGQPILEYTVGKEKSLPDLVLAKERFKRRRTTVEYYYKKMDKIETRLKTFFWDPPAMLVDLIGGIFRWPFMAVADYKYNRNLKYKEKEDKLDEQKEELEKARVNTLKEKLAVYIAQDLNKESSSQNAVAAAFEVAKIEAAPESLPMVPVLSTTPEVVPKAEVPISLETVSQIPVVEPVSVPEVGSIPALVVDPPPVSAVEAISAPVVEPPMVIQPVIKNKVVVKPVLVPPVAVIVAKPLKGISPLKVIFFGQKSFSKSGKIVAYNWDFGDGDTSTKKNPENTYWSTTFGARNFTATLTVRDDVGNTSSANVIIEVITK